MEDISQSAVDKAGNVFSATLPDGSLPLGSDHALGVYMDDCRYVSGHRAEGAAGVVRTLDARGLVHERIDARGDVTLRLAADFAPMLALRGFAPPPAPGAVRCEPVAGGLRLHARGRDGVLRSTTVTADPAPDEVDAAGVLRFRGARAIALRYVLEPAPPPPAPAAPHATVEVDDPALQRLLDRARDDLRLLRSSMHGLSYFAAGVPWYVALFGRDSLITALQVLPFAPDMAEQTLRLLARELGTRMDTVREEDPGKVLHELRPGEAAAAGLTPLARYYGTVDATPLWLCLLADHADVAGSLDLFRELRPAAEAMVGWLDGAGDRDGDGLLDYAARAPGGLRNQGWKDSAAGVPDERGRPLEPPVALVEPQGYAIRARRGLARLYERDGDAATAGRLRLAADAHAARLERLWLEDRGFYAIGADGTGRASRALASNQGHLLWARAVAPARARAIRDALMGPDMFSGWGIRTLGAAEAGYDPLSYHLGSVWPHDCALIAAGLREHGFDADFLRVFGGLLDAAAGAADQRLPELFGGQPRGDEAAPVPYPVACRPQAWAAGALPHLGAAALGLVPEGLDGRLTIRRPLLPHGTGAAHVRGLRIAGARVDLRVERGRDGRAVARAAVDGDLDVRVEP